MLKRVREGGKRARYALKEWESPFLGSPFPANLYTHPPNPDTFIYRFPLSSHGVSSIIRFHEWMDGWMDGLALWSESVGWVEARRGAVGGGAGGGGGGGGEG